MTTIASAPNGWVLFDDMPLDKPAGTSEPQPVIFDGDGRFVANFGFHDGSTENALIVMRALGGETLGEKAP